MASNTPLLAYKFLHPNFKVSLNIKKHEDVAVLIAVIDCAIFTATVSEEGRVMIKVVLQIRNTQKQFVRIKVPQEFEVWSTMVAALPVKPAIDDQGYVMIPLKKVTKQEDETSQAPFEVQLIYLVKVREMEERSSLTLEFPYVDIPINHLLVSLYLPANYQYFEFKGMREVLYWSRQPPLIQAPGQMQMQIHDQMQLGERMDRMRDSISMDMDINIESYQSSYARKNNKRGGGRGLVPVKVEMPTTGREFKFEQLLVQQKNMEISVEYKRVAFTNWRKKKSCC